MRVQEVLEKTTGFFREKGIPTARLDAEILLSHALQFDRIQLYLKFDQPLAEPELVKCREAVRRRAQGEPVAYITGTKGFFGYDFIVNPSVLIPRPETELIVESAVDWAKKRTNKKELMILDLGTGSGCLGLTLLKEILDAHLIAVDISIEALETAKKNAENLNLLHRVTFIESDAVMSQEHVRQLLNQKQIDIFVANPPYIDFDDARVEENVKKFEPHQALYAEENGLKLLKEWSSSFGNFLAQDSICLMEMGLDQGPAMLKYFSDLSIFNEVVILKDLSGFDRVIKGVKNG